MRHWTPEERSRQAQLIQNWKPWKLAGVKTPEGKEISKMNAYKHGGRSVEGKAEAECLRELKMLCQQICKKPKPV